MRKHANLVIVSHVVHYRHDGRLFAYGPYAREIDIWADLFASVQIAAPCRHETPPGDAVPFTRTNIGLRPQREQGGDTWQAKWAQLVRTPLMIRDLMMVLHGADAVHVRCPGNLGLLGVMVAPLFCDRLIAKYAGQWNGYAGEPLAVRLQRWLLASRWWRGPVTVYGRWPGQPAHIVPFFTSMMTAEQQQRAAAVAAARHLDAPLRVLFMGTLSARKRADALIDGVAHARAAGVPIQLAIVGGGADRAALEAQATARGVRDLTTFAGALPFDEALAWYEWADCLVLPSRHSEGWPKVVAEAMSFGVIAMAVDHGQVRSMLEGRGVLLASGTAEEIGNALCAIARQPAAHRALAQAGAEWAGQFSLEGLRDALHSLLVERWPPGAVAVAAPVGAARGQWVP